MIDLTNGIPEFKYTDDGVIQDLDTLDAETKTSCYEELMVRAILGRAWVRNPGADKDKLTQYIQHIVGWIRDTDFYTSPASTKYHDACHGGLLNHTLQVYNQLVGLREVPKFKAVVEDQWWSAVFVALVHDWCKIGRYESYLKNVKNNETGVWEQVPGFKYKEDGVGRFGHGTQSLIMAMQICNTKLTSLTFEEMAAIRWHMDNWDMASYDVEDLGRCNAKIPMVRMIQFADQLAITEY